MSAQEFDRLNWIKPGIIHPMMGLAHERKIVLIVVACVLI
jgi:hypothetical protein